MSWKIVIKEEIFSRYFTNIKFLIISNRKKIYIKKFILTSINFFKFQRVSNIRKFYFSIRRGYRPICRSQVIKIYPNVILLSIVRY